MSEQQPVVPTSKVPRVVAEYFEDVNDIRKHTHYDELFNASRDNVDLQTQLSETELRAIATLQTNDKFLNKKGVRNVYENYLNSFMRLKISLDRQSRKEYVEVNKNERDDATLMQRLTSGIGNGMVRR